MVKLQEIDGDIGGSNWKQYIVIFRNGAQTVVSGTTIRQAINKIDAISSVISIGEFGVVKDELINLCECEKPYPAYQFGTSQCLACLGQIA